MSDLRLCFSENGLAKSYELGLHDQAAWTHLAAVLRQGSGQLILLVPTVDPASQYKVTLQLEPGEFQGGSIQDGWIVVAEGEQETMRFPIVVAGTLILEPN